MKWILAVPNVSDGVLFTYEVIRFLFLIAGLILSVLVCMHGYKMLRIAFMIGASFVFGLLGFRVSDRLFLKNQFWITALPGAGVFGLLVFSLVFRNLFVVILISLILAVVGGVVRHRKKEKERPAHIYDDLLEMPRRPVPEEETQG